MAMITKILIITNFNTEDYDRDFSDDDVPIEQFTASDFDDFDFESDDEYPDSNIEFNDSWILLWILKYQARFRLPDVAINSLIKFFGLFCRMQIMKDLRTFQQVLT